MFQNTNESITFLQHHGMLGHSEYSIQEKHTHTHNLRDFSATAVLSSLPCQLSNFQMRMVETKDLTQCINVYTSYCSIHVPFSEGLCSLHHFRTHVILRLRNNNFLFVAELNIVAKYELRCKRSLWKRLNAVGGALNEPSWLTHLFRRFWLFQVIIVIGFVSRIFHFLFITPACTVHFDIKHRIIMMRSVRSNFYFSI